MKTSNIKKKNKNMQDNNKFNFDNDYFIGSSEQKTKENINIKKRDNENQSNTDYIGLNTDENLYGKNKISNRRIIEKEREKIRKKKISRIVLLVFILIFIIVCLTISPIFNVEEIEVKDNSKISSDRIISVSEIKEYKNMFLFNKNTAIKKILKSEPYIESATIKRTIPNKVTIYVKERKPVLQIKLEDDTYVYINNQGYVLEFSEEKLENTPVISQIETDLINLKNEDKTIRLNENDLNFLGIILKVMSIMKDYQMDSYIVKFDLSNSDDLIVTLNQKNKKVHFGDCSDLNTRVLYLKKILEDTKNEKGEIFINGDLNEDYVYFRKEV